MDVQLSRFENLQQDTRNKLEKQKIKTTEKLLDNFSWPSVRKTLMWLTSTTEAELRPWIIASDLSRVEGMPIEVIEKIVTLDYVSNVQSFSRQQASKLAAAFTSLEKKEKDRLIPKLENWISKAKKLPAYVIWDLKILNDYQEFSEAYIAQRRRSFRQLSKMIIGFFILLSCILVIQHFVFGINYYLSNKFAILQIYGFKDYWGGQFLLLFKNLDSLLLLPVLMLVPTYILKALSLQYDIRIKPSLAKNPEVQRQLVNYTVVDTKINKVLLFGIGILFCILSIIIANLISKNIDFARNQATLEETTSFLWSTLDILIPVVIVIGLLGILSIVIFKWAKLKPVSVVQKSAFSILMSDRLAQSLIVLVFVGLVFGAILFMGYIHEIWLRQIIVPLFGGATEIFTTVIPLERLSSITFISLVESKVFLEHYVPLLYRSLGLLIIGFVFVYVVIPSMLIKNFKQLIYSIILIFGAWWADSLFAGFGDNLGIPKGTIFYFIVAVALIFINDSTFNIIENYVEEFKDCQNCGLRNSDSANFCSNCGNRLV